MNTKTGGIIGALVALLLCCFGLILSSFGVLAIATPPPPGTTYSASNLVYAAICVGLILMLISAGVGFVTWRRRRTPGSMQPARADASAPAYAPPASPTPARPAAPNVSAPAYPPPVAHAPLASSIESNTPGMDALTRQVHDRIMALNRPSAPYQIVDGKAKGVDLIAEWKIVDAQWYEIFAKANLTKVFRIYMKFDASKREVRAMDEELTVSWKKGVPSLSAEASFFRGQKSSISFGTGYAFTENLTPGQVYKYKFNTNELKKPIQDAIAAAGWTYRGVAFGKL